MHTNIIILIASSLVWLIVEGLLILRDKNNAKGSTKIDKMTRLFNAEEKALAKELGSQYIEYQSKTKNLFQVYGNVMLKEVYGYHYNLYNTGSNHYVLKQ